MLPKVYGCIGMIVEPQILDSGICASHIVPLTPADSNDGSGIQAPFRFQINSREPPKGSIKDTKRSSGSFSESDNDSNNDQEEFRHLCLDIRASGTMRLKGKHR